jgi:hypothetical protein
MLQKFRVDFEIVADALEIAVRAAISHFPHKQRARGLIMSRVVKQIFL